MADDLVAFLRERLDEDERVAMAAPGNSWTAHTQDSVAAASVYDEQWRLLEPEHYDHDEPLSNKPGATGPGYINRARDELVAHIARHDPARVLAEVQAKRRIIEEHAPVDPCDAHDAALRSIACETLRLLALPYAAHADYRAEWAPDTAAKPCTGAHEEPEEILLGGGGVTYRCSRCGQRWFEPGLPS